MCVILQCHPQQIFNSMYTFSLNFQGLLSPSKSNLWNICCLVKFFFCILPLPILHWQSGEHVWEGQDPTEKIYREGLWLFLYSTADNYNYMNMLAILFQNHRHSYAVCASHLASRKTFQNILLLVYWDLGLYSYKHICEVRYWIWIRRP